MYRIFLIAVTVFYLSCVNVFSQETYQKPTLTNHGSWSMIMVPDIQNYVKWGRNQPLLELMTAWIEENIDTLNIKMVVCTGDLVEHNNIINPGHDGNQSAQRQWESAAHAFARLDGKVPYITALGNHDFSIDKQGKRSSRFADFFSIDKNGMNQKTLVQNSTDESGEPSLQNSAYEIKSLNGKDYLFMTVEFAPRDTVLTWARKIAAMEEYKSHRVVLLTHAYLNQKDERTGGEMKWFVYEPYSINNVIQKSERIKLPYSNNGKQIWEKLVQPASNIELVLSGHISGEGYRHDKNSAGRTVHQVLFDAQSMGGGHRDGNGGDGWLRILEFFPDGKTVKVKTFSPLFGASPSTRQLAWKKDNRNEFTIRFD